MRLISRAVPRRAVITMGLLWSRSLDGGRGEVKMTDIPLDGSSMHVSQYDRSTKTHNSWDTNGSIDGCEPGSMHFTNQTIDKGDPARHAQS